MRLISWNGNLHALSQLPCSTMNHPPSYISTISKNKNCLREDFDSLIEKVLNRFMMKVSRQQAKSHSPSEASATNKNKNSLKTHSAGAPIVRGDLFIKTQEREALVRPTLALHCSKLIGMALLSAAMWCLLSSMRAYEF